MELVRALARPTQTAWLAGMTRLGGTVLRPSATRTNPPNRMVELESWGHSDFLFGHSHELFCPHRALGVPGGPGIAVSWLRGSSTCNAMPSRATVMPRSCTALLR